MKVLRFYSDIKKLKIENYQFHGGVLEVMSNDPIIKKLRKLPLKTANIYDNVNKLFNKPRKQPEKAKSITVMGKTDIVTKIPKKQKVVTLKGANDES